MRACQNGIQEKNAPSHGKEDDERNQTEEEEEETTKQPHVHQPWTTAEDLKLQQMQEKYGNKWATVAASLPGRTGQQCAQRWRHRVNPNIRREKWTKEEDEKLAALYDQHGQRWAIIARSLSGRTDQQCMGRWRRHLDPSVERGNWKTEEDERLKKAFETHGARWAFIARDIEGRTAQQCRARFYQLNQTQEEEKKGKRKKKMRQTTEEAEEDGAKKDEEEGKKRKKRKTSGTKNSGGKENANRNSNKSGTKSSAKFAPVAKGSLAEAFPPITASMEQISLREEKDEAKKGSLEPIQFDQVAAMKENADDAMVATLSVPAKKKKPATGTEDGEETMNVDKNHQRFFALDPSKSVTAPSTPEEKTEKPPPARSSRSTKKTTSTLFSPPTKKRSKLSSATPTADSANNNKNNKGSKPKNAAKPKASRRTPALTDGRRRTSIAKNDAFRGTEDDTLTLLCAAAERLESLFSPPAAVLENFSP